MTPKYIDLCRKLALPRVLEMLDLIFFDGEVRPCPSRFIGYELDSLFLKPIECFWLPREGDWLDLLEAEGYNEVEISTRLGTYRATARWVDMDGVTHARYDSYNRPDRLLALACVYRDVKGIKP